ncbi:MAG: family 43 glycosylhydrolase [Gemmatimonadaceae bacterium]|nr:family 43 glycosylhydrolase [Gemmatimonadaceae bacterium]NUQ93196.1 family 43 glycosylhydrolase [Gemmatimonadaceae bacterium]NUS97187.1 family 43 glycosylhydrolase [Gemmatimonadaceae bacterium]
MTSRTLRRLAVSLAFVAACSSGGGVTRVDRTTPTGYVNPVLDQDFPDPAILRAPDGVYYAYATQTNAGAGLINIQGAKSSDLVSWTPLGEMLPARPSWAQSHWNFWAPHVLYAAEQSRYVMYYSAQSDTSNMCIGIATSAAPNGPFVDTGSPLVCGSDFSHIDPMAYDDPVSGKKYLYWGSNSKPIDVQELAADRVHFAAASSPAAALLPDNARPYEGLIEGPWVIRRDGYYYMFYSGNDCCSRTNPHYAVMVARSTSPTGPFQKLADATGASSSVILQGNTSWLAPGHNAIVTDQAGTDWIVYHAIDPSKMLIPGTQNVRRPLLIDKLVWSNGWPAVEADAPSRTDKPKPVVAP